MAVTTNHRASAQAPQRRRAAGSSGRYNRASVSEKAYRDGSSRDLPGGAILGILDCDSHGCEFVADAVRFLEILAHTRGGTLCDQSLDLGHIDAARAAFAALPLFAAFAQESKQPQRCCEGAASGLVAARVAAQPVQCGDHLRCIEIIRQYVDNRS